jgi:hypothetical protein
MAAQGSQHANVALLTSGWELVQEVPRIVGVGTSCRCGRVENTEWGPPPSLKREVPDPELNSALHESAVWRIGQ